MTEVLNMLQVAGFKDARIEGNEVHVTAHGVPLVVSESGERYSVRAVSDDQVAQLCDDSQEVVDAVKGWRR